MPATEMPFRDTCGRALWAHDKLLRSKSPQRQEAGMEQFRANFGGDPGARVGRVIATSRMISVTFPPRRPDSGKVCL